MGIRNLGALEVFVALAETQSFTVAAKQFGMTTSAASQTVKTLEKELGTALINRQCRPVTLTYAGHNLLNGARDLLQVAKDLQSSVTAATLILPFLRLGLAESISCTAGSDIVADVFPCTKKLSVRTAMAMQLSEQFSNGEFDLLISPISFPDSAGVLEKAVLAEEFFLVTPKSRPGIVTAPADLLRLANEMPFFSYTSAASDKLIAERILRSSGIMPQRRVLVESSTTMMGLVARGLGWALLLPSNIWMGREFCHALNFFKLPFISTVRNQYVAIRSQGYERVAHKAIEAHKKALQKRVIPQLEEICPLLQQGIRFLPSGE